MPPQAFVALPAVTISLKAVRAVMTGVPPQEMDAARPVPWKVDGVAAAHQAAVANAGAALSVVRKDATMETRITAMVAVAPARSKVDGVAAAHRATAALLHVATLSS